MSGDIDAQKSKGLDPKVQKRRLRERTWRRDAERKAESQTVGGQERQSRWCSPDIEESMGEKEVRGGMRRLEVA